MKKNIILTPEELYYMGTLLQAKYIDYAYVAAMGDIQQKREIYESETKESLVAKGVLMEDFSGNLEVESDVKKLLEPIFFGELESSIDVVYFVNDGRRFAQSKRFHFYEGQLTTTVMTKKEINVMAEDDGMLQEWIARILPVDYAAQEEIVSAKSIDRKKIGRIIAVKSTKVGQRSAVNIYIDYEGKILREKEDGQAIVLTKEQFELEIYKGAKGE